MRIPRAARIAAVADAWDAMTSDRPYRGALDREEAMRRLRAGAGRQWDPEPVDVMLYLLQRDDIAALVRRQLARAADESALA